MKQFNFLIYLTFGSLLLFVQPAFADCGDDPANLLQNLNCDFDNNVDGWDLKPVYGGDSLSHNTALSHPQGMTAGSLQVDAVDFSSSSNVFTVQAVGPCLDVESDAAYTLSGYFKAVSGNPSCQITLLRYPETACGGSYIFTSHGGVQINTSNWVQSSYTHMVKEDQKSVAPAIFCEDKTPSDFVVLLDNISLTADIPDPDPEPAPATPIPSLSAGSTLGLILMVLLFGAWHYAVYFRGRQYKKQG